MGSTLLVVSGQMEAMAGGHSLLVKPGKSRVYHSSANHPDHNPGNSGHYHELDDADRGHGYGERSVVRTGGGPCRAGRRIDLIFARRSRIVNDRYGSDALSIPTDCTGICSDHRPVVGWARLRIRRE